MTQDQNKNWWMFYQLKGLEIFDEQLDFENPLFGDFTVFSVNQISAMADLINLEQNMPPEKTTEERLGLAQFMSLGVGGANCDSILAVRRNGILPNTNIQEEPQFVTDAQNRANQIVALFSILLLSTSPTAKTFGLSQNYIDTASTHLMVSFETGSLRYSVTSLDFYAKMVSYPPDNFKVTRNQLKELSENEVFKPYSESLLPQRPKLGQSLRIAIHQASVRFLDVLHSLSLSAQVLGAITSVEILLATEQNDKYEVIRQRVATVLGKKLYSALEAENIFHARHLYVHQGKEVTDSNLADKAAGLVMLLLFSYAEMAQNFTDKPQLVKYLDFVAQNENLTGLWNTEESKLVSSLRKHTETQNKLGLLNLPFFKTYLHLTLT